MTNKYKKEELLSLFEMHPSRVAMLPAEDKALVVLFLSSLKYTAIAKLTQQTDVVIARKLKKMPPGYPATILPLSCQQKI